MRRTAYEVLLDWAHALGLAPAVGARAGGVSGESVSAGVLPLGPKALAPPGMPRPEWPDRAPAFEGFDIAAVMAAIEDRLAQAEAELDRADPAADDEARAFARLKVEALREDLRSLREWAGDPPPTQA